MKTILVFLGLAIAFILTVAVTGADNQGAEHIKIYGGSRGEVPFPHRAHQERLTDCSVCHAVFPQEVDGIKKMKESGTLKPKEVMNKQCVSCHKETQKAGNPSGPTTCSKCHQKG